MAKKKQLEYFEDKYGIKTLKTPISENDKALLEKLSNDAQQVFGFKVIYFAD